MTFVVLSKLFGVLVEERLLVEGGCPFRYYGRATGVGRAGEGYLADKAVLSRRQDDPEVAVLDPAAGTIDRRRIHSEETMGVSNGRIVRFPPLLGGGWGREAVGDDVD